MFFFEDRVSLSSNEPKKKSDKNFLEFSLQNIENFFLKILFDMKYDQRLTENVIENLFVLMFRCDFFVNDII